MQLVVSVKKLNKRKEIPLSLPEPFGIVGQVNEGYSFEGIEITAVPNVALGKWYRDRDGFFYWGGGVIELKTLDQRPWQFIQSKMSWVHDSVANGGLGIVDLWNKMRVRGKGVKVAVIDSGVDISHIDLKPIFSISFLSDSSMIDSEGHGTNMAGIIGGLGHIVTGIAPECELLIAKTDPEITDSIVKALQWANEKNVDVISISFECQMDSKIEIELQKCFNNNIAIISSAGNSGELDIIINNFPASSPYCFSIGCFGKNYKRMACSNISNYLKLLAPGEKILTAALENKKEEINGDTSIATAITSGVVALFLASERYKSRQVYGKEIIEILCKNADKRNNGNDNYNFYYGFGLLSPNTLNFT